MPASGDGGGDVERCIVASGRVAPEAGSESSEPPHAASATKSGIKARTARLTAPECRSAEAVNEGIRSAQELAASKMNAAAGGLAPGGLGGLGLPGR
jgi:hypothetical protein